MIFDRIEVRGLGFGLDVTEARVRVGTGVAGSVGGSDVGFVGASKTVDIVEM